jgi:hypothetical protein
MRKIRKIKNHITCPLPHNSTQICYKNFIRSKILTTLAISGFTKCWHMNRTRSQMLLLDTEKPDYLVSETAPSGFVDSDGSQRRRRHYTRGLLL